MGVFSVPNWDNGVSLDAPTVDGSVGDCIVRGAGESTSFAARATSAEVAAALATANAYTDAAVLGLATEAYADAAAAAAQAASQPLDAQLTSLASLAYAGNALKVIQVNAGETGFELVTISSGVTDHGALTGLTDDDHAQYALLAGRNGGQTLNLDTVSGGSGQLHSTAHATKGPIYFNGSTTSGALINAAREFSNSMGFTNTERFGAGITSLVGSGNPENQQSTAIGAACKHRDLSVVVGATAEAGQAAVVIGSAAAAGSGGPGNCVIIGYAAAGTNGSCVVLGRAATATATGQFVVGSGTIPITDFYFGKGVTSTAAETSTIHGTGGNAATSNNPGGNLILCPGIGRGNATPTSVIIQSMVAAASGTTAQTPLNTVTVTNNIVSLGGHTAATELRFLEPSGSGTNYTAFKAQAQSADITYTLPATDANGFLRNTSGTWSWETAGSAVDGTDFTANASANAFFAESTSTGGTGATAYKFADVIKNLKAAGILAA